jgi:hypothetical protein
MLSDGMLSAGARRLPPLTGGHSDFNGWVILRPLYLMPVGLRIGAIADLAITC